MKVVRERGLASIKLLVGVCGSSSSVIVPHMVLWVRSELGISQVRVVLTGMAQRFLTVESLATIPDCEVATGWDDIPGRLKTHIALANWADVLLILPSTANFLGRVANGIADDLLSSIVLAASCPVVIVPATSSTAWNKPAVQRNVSLLVEDGYHVVLPTNGTSWTDGSLEFGSLGDFRRPVLDAISKAIRNGGAQA